MYLNRDLGGAQLGRDETGREPACRKNNNPPRTMDDNAAGEATKKRPVIGRLLSLSAIYVQG